MNKNIFITGATGYLGQRLAFNLADSGKFIHVLVRDVAKAKTLLAHPAIKLFKGDILDKASIAPAIANCEQAYHLAALASVWNPNPKSFEEVNVKGLQNVLDCCIDAGIQDVVFTSTAGVVGHSENMRPVAELTNLNPKLETHYERSKLNAELILKRYVDKGLRAIIVNPSRVFGPGLLTESNGFTRLIKMYISGKWNIMPGNGSSVGNYVFVDDVIRGLILAMDKASAGERYLLGGTDASYNEFFSLIRETSGCSNTLYRMPLPLMLFISYIQMGLANTTGRHPLITPPFVRKYAKNWSVSSEKAIKELGYSITPLEIGMAKTLTWLDKANQFSNSL